MAWRALAKIYPAACLREFYTTAAAVETHMNPYITIYSPFHPTSVHGFLACICI